jgi:hypothetical protein
MNDEALSDELLAIERRLWSGGEDDYRAAVDDRCALAFPSFAAVATRDDVSNSVATGPRWRDLTIELVGVLRPTDEIAFVTYKASARRGEHERYRALVGSGYVRRADGWKLAFHQQTPLPLDA